MNASSRTGPSQTLPRLPQVRQDSSQASPSRFPTLSHVDSPYELSRIPSHSLAPSLPPEHHPSTATFPSALCDRPTLAADATYPRLPSLSLLLHMALGNYERLDKIGEGARLPFEPWITDLARTPALLELGA